MLKESVNNQFSFLSPEIGRRPLHVHRCDLERDGLELRQEVEVHEVLLAEDAGALAPAVDGRRLDDQLDLGHRHLESERFH